MDLGTLLNTALLFHIVGITCMAGATLVDFLLTKKFWDQYEMDKSKALAVRNALGSIPSLMIAGILLLILSGVGMMAITQGVFGEQIWFKIKFALVIIVILNGILVGRKQGVRLNAVLLKNSDESDLSPELKKIRKRVNLFHISQLFLFLTIFILSVFKFN
jgi:uncharacterized membrane protein SirB2